MEQSAELVVITDPDGRIEYVNPAFERVTGWRAVEVIGKTPAILKSGHHPPEVYGDLWARVTAGRTWTGQFRNRRKDGTLFLADVVISAVRGADGGIINLVGVQRDITRERELDDQLRQAQKMEAVGQLTGGIAHDFNNLLTVILANVSLLRDSIGGGGAAPASESYLLDIQTAARRGGEMVKKLLAFGRQERLDLGSLQLDRVVGDFLATLRRLLPESVELRFDAPVGLPPVEADLGAVEQILLNLVTNARDAMPKGGILSITLAPAAVAPGGLAPAPEGWVHLAVRDGGEGMEPSVLARVFEPFFTTKPTGKGTGLGMAMVYGLVKQHRGLIEVESDAGAGTTVHVWLPATRPRPVEPAAGVAATPRGQGETILLAEDEAPIRRAATRILEGLGYTVLAARDGVEALELFAAHEREVALVISDVTMPRLNGPDLLEALRARGARVPVLFATGYAVRRSSQAEGELRFLEKPWTVEELASRVQEALEHGKSGAPA
jgi:two-component system NtrC family sensor kinase